MCFLMTIENKNSEFDAKLLCPQSPGNGDTWAFVILPKKVSATLPRRGRITVDGSINGNAFRALLEPDGQKSHWLKIDMKLIKKSEVNLGDVAHFEIVALEQEPKPETPADFASALKVSKEAKAIWEDTSNIAKLDWIHWITSAKQNKTRKKRINDACDMLASGKKRVCCFDTSGFYSKAFSAPKAIE